MAYQEFDVGDAGRLSLGRDAKSWSKRLYKILTGDIEMRDGLKSKTVQRFVNESTDNLQYTLHVDLKPLFINALRSPMEAVKQEIYEREVKIATMTWLSKNQSRIIKEILDEL